MIREEAIDLQQQKHSLNKVETQLYWNWPQPENFMQGNWKL